MLTSYMIIYTEFIIKKEEKKRNAAVFYCGVSYLGRMREKEKSKVTADPAAG